MKFVEIIVIIVDYVINLNYPSLIRSVDINVQLSQLKTTWKITAAAKTNYHLASRLYHC